MQLKSLQLKNSIEDFILDVNVTNLGDVNYFVGESNSGKSFLLETLHQKNLKVGYLKDSPSFSDFWDNKIKNWEELTINRVALLDILDYRQATSHEKYIDIDEEVKIILQEFGQYENEVILKGKHSDPKASVSSVKKIYNLIFWIVYFIVVNDVDLIAIDEPECHLHPHITKTLPTLFEYLSDRYSIQFFIATHSPFLLSAVAKLTYEETLIKQTVYLLKDGKLIDKHNEFTPNASAGYWGPKLIPIVNDLLGSGIEDLFIEQSVEPTPDSPILVLCEGQNGDEDARIYNIIFDKIVPEVMFVSCKGSSQLYRSFQLLNKVKPGLSANLRIYMIRDRDAEFPDFESIELWEKNNPNAKILTKRAMECYLFNTETASKLNKRYSIQSDSKKLDNLNNLLFRIDQEVHNGVKTSNYKEDLLIVFSRATNFILDSKVEKTLHFETLAGLITPDTEIYKLLYNDIFK
jgi:hypothetical protein